MTMASYKGSLRVFLSVAVPKYSLPLALIFASRVSVGLGRADEEDVLELVGQPQVGGEVEGG